MELCRIYTQGLINEIINYYFIDKNKPAIHLKAEKLSSHRKRGVSYFTVPRGELYTENGVIQYEALKGQLNQISNHLKLLDEVVIVHGKNELKSDVASYDFKRSFIDAHGNVVTDAVMEKSLDRLKIHSSRVLAWPHCVVVTRCPTGRRVSTASAYVTASKPKTGDRKNRDRPRFK